MNRDTDRSYRGSGVQRTGDQPRDKLVHTDGRRFHTRVQVHFGEKYLFHVHAEHAQAMVQEGIARVDPEGKRVWRLFLVSSTIGLVPEKRVEPQSIGEAVRRYFMSKPTTYRERFKGHPFSFTISHKKIPRQDAWAYWRRKEDA